MKKNKFLITLILFGFVVLIISFLNIRKNLDLFLKKAPEKWPKHITIPNDYLQLFNRNVNEVKNITSLKYDNSYPISFIKINDMNGLITKFKGSNSISYSFIKNNNVKQTPRVWYKDFSTKDLTISFNEPQKPIKELIVMSDNIDTVLYSKKSTILKGNLNKIGISLLESNKNLDNYSDPKLNFYFEDRRLFSYLKDDFKYYLILKKFNRTIYLVFLKSEDFNDKNILSLFEK